MKSPARIPVLVFGAPPIPFRVSRVLSALPDAARFCRAPAPSAVPSASLRGYGNFASITMTGCRPRNVRGAATNPPARRLAAPRGRQPGREAQRRRRRRVAAHRQPTPHSRNPAAWCASSVRTRTSAGAHRVVLGRPSSHMRRTIGGPARVQAQGDVDQDAVDAVPDRRQHPAVPAVAKCRTSPQAGPPIGRWALVLRPCRAGRMPAGRPNRRRTRCGGSEPPRRAHRRGASGGSRLSESESGRRHPSSMCSAAVDRRGLSEDPSDACPNRRR